jgi:hypothetical protein
MIDTFPTRRELLLGTVVATLPGILEAQVAAPSARFMNRFEK